MNVLKLMCYGAAVASFTALNSCQSPESGDDDPKIDQSKTGLLGSATTTTPYTPIFKGIEYSAATDKIPRLQRAFALRIDLQNTNLQVRATPSNGTSGGETTLQTTPAFLDALNLKVAINANFFTASGSATNNEGLVISNGTVVSNAQSGTFSSQLVFTSDKIADLLSSSSNPSGIYNAVGGAEIILKNGVNVGTNPDVQPRTVMGLSQNKRYLILVVVDGRQPGWSEGVNHAEAANWLKFFGAYDGAVFDGGGSSCLVRDNGSGSPQILNRPSGGSARAVGANLGIYSQPL